MLCGNVCVVVANIISGYNRMLCGNVCVVVANMTKRARVVSDECNAFLVL